MKILLPKFRSNKLYTFVKKNRFYLGSFLVAYLLNYRSLFTNNLFFEGGDWISPSSRSQLIWNYLDYLNVFQINTIPGSLAVDQSSWFILFIQYLPQAISSTIESLSVVNKIIIFAVFYIISLNFFILLKSLKIKNPIILLILPLIYGINPITYDYLQIGWINLLIAISIVPLIIYFLQKIIFGEYRIKRYQYFVLGLFMSGTFLFISLIVILFMFLITVKRVNYLEIISRYFLITFCFLFSHLWWILPKLFIKGNSGVLSYENTPVSKAINLNYSFFDSIFFSKSTWNNSYFMTLPIFINAIQIITFAVLLIILLRNNEITALAKEHYIITSRSIILFLLIFSIYSSIYIFNLQGSGFFSNVMGRQESRIQPFILFFALLFFSVAIEQHFNRIANLRILRYITSTLLVVGLISLMVPNIFDLRPRDGTAGLKIQSHVELDYPTLLLVLKKDLGTSFIYKFPTEDYLDVNRTLNEYGKILNPLMKLPYSKFGGINDKFQVQNPIYFQNLYDLENTLKEYCFIIDQNYDTIIYDSYLASPNDFEVMNLLWSNPNYQDISKKNGLMETKFRVIKKIESPVKSDLRCSILHREGTLRTNSSSIEVNQFRFLPGQPFLKIDIKIFDPERTLVTLPLAFQKSFSVTSENATVTVEDYYGLTAVGVKSQELGNHQIFLYHNDQKYYGAFFVSTLFSLAIYLLFAIRKVGFRRKNEYIQK